MREHSSDLLKRWASGGVARGNVEGALKAEKRQQRFKGGQDCPADCGSVIAYEEGKDPQKSVRRHLDDPKACRKHPQNKKAKK
jgi:hypothetical protein